MPVELRPAGEADIAFMMSAERQPGYDTLVGRFTEDEHRTNLADPTASYQLAIGADALPLGFVLFNDIGDAHQNLYVRRVVVAHAEKGTGTAMMVLGLNWAFHHGGAQRIWLTHLPHNHRAHALYRKLGFIQEGVLRQAYRRVDGTRGDLITMALLKPEWDARHAT
jgi:RimJ/RimL family protein N-acetyltransferase